MHKAKILSLMLGGLFILGGCVTGADVAPKSETTGYDGNGMAVSEYMNTRRDVEVFSVDSKDFSMAKREPAIDHSIVQDSTVTIYNVENRQASVVKINEEVKIQSNGRWRSLSSMRNGRLDIGDVDSSNKNLTYNE
jgi:PBP1b-binding outer membrane lipoprotein LpoB